MIRAFFLKPLLITGLCLFSVGADFRGAHVLGQNLVWTDVINETGRTLCFQAGLNWNNWNMDEVVLEPEEKKHFPGASAVKVRFYRGDELLLYRLNPGPQYIFRLDKTGFPDVYADPPVNKKLDYFVPFVVTPPKVIDRMLEMAGLSSDDVVYDLGSGDGRIVITAAKKYKARGVGIDIDSRRILEAREYAERHGVSDLVKFREKDALKVDLTGATVVTVYMSMQFNQKLRPVLESDLDAGDRVVAHNYAVPGWAHRLVRYDTLETANGTEHIIFLYQ
jgi:predicted RNA methylase